MKEKAQVTNWFPKYYDYCKFDSIVLFIDSYKMQSCCLCVIILSINKTTTGRLCVCYRPSFDKNFNLSWLLVIYFSTEIRFMLYFSPRLGYVFGYVCLSVTITPEAMNRSLWNFCSSVVIRPMNTSKCLMFLQSPLVKICTLRVGPSFYSFFSRSDLSRFFPANL